MLRRENVARIQFLKSNNINELVERQIAYRILNSPWTGVPLSAEIVVAAWDCFGMSGF